MLPPRRSQSVRGNALTGAARPLPTRVSAGWPSSPAQRRRGRGSRSLRTTQPASRGTDPSWRRPPPHPEGPRCPPSLATGGCRRTLQDLESQRSTLGWPSNEPEHASLRRLDLAESAPTLDEICVLLVPHPAARPQAQCWMVSSHRMDPAIVRRAERPRSRPGHGRDQSEEAPPSRMTPSTKRTLVRGPVRHDAGRRC